MATAHATSRYIRTSAQKAGLVLALDPRALTSRARWRRCGSRASSSRAISRRRCGRPIANVQQQDGFGGDVDRLYVARCWANQGPSMKRTRPAPMGRAFRVVKRMAHLTVEVAERPAKTVAADGSGEGPGQGAEAEGCGLSAAREH